MARPARRRSTRAPEDAAAKSRAPRDEAPKPEAPNAPDSGAPSAAPAPTTRNAGSPVGKGAAALAIVAFVASVALSGAQNRDVLRACVGGLAFLAGAAGAFDPRRAPVVFAFIGIVGLALVGIGPGTSGRTLTLDVGIGLAMGGVLGLGGAIHRLGRLGPA